MGADEERDSLERAEGLLLDLQGDLKSAPPEVLPLVEGYLPRLEDSIRRFKERRLSSRELEAHAFQVRLTYARDLNRLLAPDSPPPTARWFRSA